MSVCFWTVGGNWKKKTPTDMGKTFKQHTEKLWAGDTVVHLSSYIRISVFIARAWNQRGWWTCRPGRYVDGRRCSSLVHLWICLLSVDIPLRQQTQDWLNSLTCLQFLYFCSLTFFQLLFGIAHSPSPCVCMTLICWLNIWANAKCGSPRTLMGVK